MKDVLIFAPVGRDADVAKTLLESNGFSTSQANTIEESVADLEGCLTLLCTQEALLESDRMALAQQIEQQPAWSDHPIILLTMRGRGIDPRLSFLAHSVIALERPFGRDALIAAVRSAVRARKRQLEVKTLIDNQKKTEERQHLLIRELHHRVKNTLSNVQAVLGATARSTHSIEEFYKAFSARILSLARTHTFLTDDYWQLASLEQMLRAEMDPFIVEEEQLKLDGPAIHLIADLAVPLGMAFHELANNAVKHGALSVSGGRLEITWSVRRAEGVRHLDLSWIETNGPPVAPPQRKGFGTTLIERLLTVQCNADVHQAFDPDGLKIKLAVPLLEERLVPAYG